MRYFLDRNVTLRRLVKKDINRSAFSATGTATQCNIQDLNPEKTVLLSGQIGKIYEVFIEDSAADFNSGDQVVIKGITYNVKSKEVVDFGSTPFISLLIVPND